MSKTIGDLRDVLFDTLQDLKTGKITIEQAKAVSEIGQVITNTAKVEVDHIKARGGHGNSAFIGDDRSGITVHRLQG